MIGDRLTAISPIGRFNIHKKSWIAETLQTARRLAFSGIGRAAVPTAMA
jgi:hypothetical protein